MLRMQMIVLYDTSDSWGDLANTWQTDGEVMVFVGISDALGIGYQRVRVALQASDGKGFSGVSTALDRAEKC